MPTARSCLEESRELSPYDRLVRVLDLYGIKEQNLDFPVQDVIDCAAGLVQQFNIPEINSFTDEQILLLLAIADRWLAGGSLWDNEYREPCAGDDESWKYDLPACLGFTFFRRGIAESVDRYIADRGNEMRWLGWLKRCIAAEVPAVSQSVMQACRETGPGTLLHRSRTGLGFVSADGTTDLSDELPFTVVAIDQSKTQIPGSVLGYCCRHEAQSIILLPYHAGLEQSPDSFCGIEPGTLVHEYLHSQGPGFETLTYLLRGLGEMLVERCGWSYSHRNYVGLYRGLVELDADLDRLFIGTFRGNGACKAKLYRRLIALGGLKGFLALACMYDQYPLDDADRTAYGIHDFFLHPYDVGQLFGIDIWEKL